MGDMSIGATVIPIGPIAVCVATLCAISLSVRKIYSKQEKKLLKECNKVVRKIEGIM